MQTSKQKGHIMYAIMRGIELLEIYKFRDVADRVCSKLNDEMLDKNTYHVEPIQDRLRTSIEWLQAL
jgi:hypothetical protein